MTRAVLHSAAFVRVRVPASLERSLQLALAAVHAPFFTVRDDKVLVVTLQEIEWARVSSRFPASPVEQGLRLISIDDPPADPMLMRRLMEAVDAAGVRGSACPTFYRDHVVVAADQAQHCLDIVQRVLDRRQNAGLVG